MFHSARKKRKGERVFELTEESRPRLSDKPLPLKDEKVFPKDELDFTVSFLRGILDTAPYHEETLLFLGHAYTSMGRYHEGLEMDRRITRLRPNDPAAFYNLACSYALLRQTDKAFEALDAAVGKGYRDGEHMRQDPDLAPIRRDPRFERILKKIQGGIPPT